MPSYAETVGAAEQDGPYEWKFAYISSRDEEPAMRAWAEGSLGEGASSRAYIGDEAEEILAALIADTNPKHAAAGYLEQQRRQVAELGGGIVCAWKKRGA